MQLQKYMEKKRWNISSSGLAVMITAIKSSSAYKIKLLFYGLNGIVQFIVYFYLWKSLSNGVESILTYFVLSFIMQSLLPRWIAMDIGWSVKRGEISTTFLYPISFQKYYLYHSIGDVIFTFIFMGMPILGIALLANVLEPCKHFVFFTISFLLSYGVAFFCFYLIGLISFRITSIWGVFLTFDLVYLFLSGAYIPIRYMPLYLQKVTMAMPFRYIIDVPISMWQSDHISIYSLSMQCIWFVLLLLLTTVVFRREIKKLDIFGG